jgi:hypothetical protein
LAGLQTYGLLIYPAKRRQQRERYVIFGQNINFKEFFAECIKNHTFMPMIHD